MWFIFVFFAVFIFVLVPVASYQGFMTYKICSFEAFTPNQIEAAKDQGRKRLMTIILIGAGILLGVFTVCVLLYPELFGSGLSKITS